MSEAERRSFHLVQRLVESPYKKHQQAFPAAKVKSNPFGYGRMGDYELDYMGAAEFEFGAIPKASNRLAKAGEDLVVCEWSYGGHDFDFLYIGKEGEPFDEWVDWAEGRRHDSYSDRIYEVPPFDGKEPPYELKMRLNGEEPWSTERGWRAAIWWALDANVLWAFKEDGHFEKWLASMGTVPTEFLR